MSDKQKSDSEGMRRQNAEVRKYAFQSHNAQVMQYEEKRKRNVCIDPAPAISETAVF